MKPEQTSWRVYEATTNVWLNLADYAVEPSVTKPTKPWPDEAPEQEALKVAIERVRSFVWLRHLFTAAGPAPPAPKESILDRLKRAILGANHMAAAKSTRASRMRAKHYLYGRVIEYLDDPDTARYDWDTIAADERLRSAQFRYDLEVARWDMLRLCVDRAMLYRDATQTAHERQGEDYV